MGSDQSVANAARVSFHKDASNYSDEQNAKLINYLAKHKHFSPFNHAFLSFRIKAPIFVARQLVKHKFMPWNEVSRRYVDEEPEFYIPKFRPKADNVKQGSGEGEVDIRIYHGTNGIDHPFYDSCEIALETYRHMLDVGVAPEVARSILPQNMMTEWIWSGTLGAFCDMLRLRLDPHTQQESREIAKMILEQVEQKFPVSVKALLHD